MFNLLLLFLRSANMRISYDDQDDILLIQFSSDLIVRDISHGWNTHIGYATSGIAEITILDAKASGYWPIEDIEGCISDETIRKNHKSQ